VDWQTIRNTFMRAIGGDPPGAALEDTLIQAYSEHPDAVERSFEKITLAHAAGKIHSPWGALKAEVAKAVDAARNPTHDTGKSRSTALARAENWVRTTGIHYDRETEVEDELYGARGSLLQHPETKPRILELWNELRPLGVILEQEADERGHRYQQQRAALKDALSDPKVRAAIKSA